MVIRSAIDVADLVRVAELDDLDGGCHFGESRAVFCYEGVGAEQHGRCVGVHHRWDSGRFGVRQAVARRIGGGLRTDLLFSVLILPPCRKGDGVV